MRTRDLIAALILVPTLALAADTGAGSKRPRTTTRFSKADADGNGSLSRAEVVRALCELARSFDRIDRNRDGELSRAELNAWEGGTGASGGRRPPLASAMPTPTATAPSAAPRPRSMRRDWQQSLTASTATGTAS